MSYGNVDRLSRQLDIDIDVGFAPRIGAIFFWRRGCTVSPFSKMFWVAPNYHLPAFEQ